MATDDKYDRQTRLWGPHGQRALMEAKLCLLTAGPTGTETLKNLVLPGCGHITVVDGAKVTAEDVGNNFFVDADRIGQDRAQVALELLLELNPDVSGKCRAEDPVAIIGSDPGFFSQFDIVIASQLPPAALRTLAALLWDQKTPLVACRSYGLIGSIRLQVPEHAIVEGKAGRQDADLRLTKPFPALQALADEIDLEALALSDMKEYLHTPFPLLLIKWREQWMAEHDGQGCTSFSQRKAFKEWVRQQGKDPGAENLEEAVNAASAAWMPLALQPECQEAMEDPQVDNLTVDTGNFWFLVRALRDFYQNEGEGTFLPLPGSLPDMTATTQRYQAIQAAYKQQAAAERAAFEAHLQAALTGAGRAADAVPADEIGRFLKNARDIVVFRTSRVSEEHSVEAPPSGAVSEALMEAGMATMEGADEAGVKQAAAVWYVMLRAADAFHDQEGCYPGAADETLATDSDKVLGIAREIGRRYNVPTTLAPSFDDDDDDGEDGGQPAAAAGAESQWITADHAAEITRYGACEPHAIAAYVGGVASQEVIKLLTHQFTPVNNTFVYNGIASTAIALNV